MNLATGECAVYLGGVEQVSHHVACQARVVSGHHLSLQLHQQPFRGAAAIHSASVGAVTTSISFPVSANNKPGTLLAHVLPYEYLNHSVGL